MGRPKGELGINEMFEVYMQMSETPAEEKTYKRIVRDFNKEASKTLLEGKILHLPTLFAEMMVAKKKMSYKKLYLDYQYYQQTGKKAYHLNEHSDDYYAKWYWRKSRCKIKGKMPYSFVPCRANKRQLAKLMKEKGGHRRFMERTFSNI